jgi:hypothetical protein
MNFKELYEGVEPNMPGAPKGIQIMTPQQFVAKAGDATEEQDVVEDGVGGTAEWGYGLLDKRNMKAKNPEIQNDLKKFRAWLSGGPKIDGNVLIGVETYFKQIDAIDDGQAAEIMTNIIKSTGSDPAYRPGTDLVQKVLPFVDAAIKVPLHPGKIETNDPSYLNQNGQYTPQQPGEPGQPGSSQAQPAGPAQPAGQPQSAGQAQPAGQPRPAGQAQQATQPGATATPKPNSPPAPGTMANPIRKPGKFMGPAVMAAPRLKEQNTEEVEKHLARIRKLSGLEEATKLPASTRDFGGDEFQDYMKRIAGAPDTDKAGNVKVDKKGNEKYVSGKTKTDKYKMPYIHRSSVVTYLSPDGKTYDEDAVKKTLAIRPKALLKQNEKMKHSNGEFEQFFNVGFAALTGIALDEDTNKLIIVNTCPGAGSCKVDCFAMKGGKVQFQGPWQSDGRILTYLLNDPDGFFNQLSAEITAESDAGKKGDKKFPNGWQTTVRWHDAGDFFSPEYLDMALKMAAKHPDVRFYAYTKMAGAALAKKPDNFIINWSEGANTTQEKQVKQQDPNLDKTKNSRIVPEKLFYDLLAKDEKGNLKKTSDGAWQPASPEALTDMKQRIAKEYGISPSSILSYNEYMAKRKSIPSGMKYNVIVAPGEGDVSANDPGVLSTLLLRH